MALCQQWPNLWKQFWLCGVVLVTWIHADNSAYLYVKKEEFLGLVLPTCRSWQCDDTCDDPRSHWSLGSPGCHCDNLCLLYGDCCYGYFTDCLRYSVLEIQESIRLSRLEFYNNVERPDLRYKDAENIIKYDRCSSVKLGTDLDQDFGVYLISRCPDSWADNMTEELCENQEISNWLNSIPVSNATGLRQHYRNIHCARCHGIKSDDVMFWNAELKCSNGTKLSIPKTLKPKYVSEKLHSGKCILVSSAPPQSVKPRQCWRGPRVNVTVCGEENEEFHKRGPEKWYTMGVTGSSGSEFLNPHRAKSCGEVTSLLKCLSPVILELPEVSTSNALVFHKENNFHNPILRTPRKLYPFRAPSCPKDMVYHFFNERCVALECSTGWYRHEGQCRPNEVSTIPGDYARLQTDNLFIKLMLATSSEDISCENIWLQDTVAMLFNILGTLVSEIDRKACQMSSDRHELRLRKEDGVVSLSNPGSTVLGNATKAELKKTRTERENGETAVDAITEVEPAPVVSDKSDSGNLPNPGIPTDKAEHTISPVLRKKLIDMVGLGKQGPTYIQIVAKLSHFDMDLLEDGVSLIKAEMRRQLKPQEPLTVESVHLSNYNSTPTCHRAIDARKNLQIYKKDDGLFGYDASRKVQISLESVPLEISIEEKGASEIVSSVSVFLCHLPTTVSTPDCLSMMTYDREDYILHNYSLYINATGKLYGRGKFQILRNIAYVCPPENNTNITTEITVNRGFFTMPYVQYIVVMVCCCVSLACLLATFITYVCFAQLRDISGIILMCLTASLFVAQLLFAGGIDRTEIEVVCKVIAVSLHFLWLSVFAWMNVLTYDIAHKLRLTSEEAASKNSKAFKEYCIFAWGVPFLLVGICTALDIAKGSGFEMEYAKDSCWIGSIVPSIFGFGLPVSLLLVANIALTICTLFALHTLAKRALLSEKQKKSRHLLIVYSGLTLLMGLSWAFAYVASLTGRQEMWFVFGGLSGLQGIFTVCCFVFRRRVIQLYKNRFGSNMKTEYPPEEFV